MSAPPTDEALMLLYRAGDLSAFEELYRRHSHGLYRFIAWRSPRRDWVDEIVQDVWANLHAARANYQPQAAFRTWLYQIGRNRLIDFLRARDSDPVAQTTGDDGDLEAELPDGTTPEADLEKKQQLAQLHAAIRQLPAEQKEALVLQQFNGMSLDEIAAITQVNTETVKSRLRYAMQKLRANLQQKTGMTA